MKGKVMTPWKRKLFTRHETWHADDSIFHPHHSGQCAFVAVLLEADVQRDVGGSEWEETDEEEGTEEEGCEWLWICVTGRHWLTWWQTLMLHVSLCDYCSKQLYLLSEKAAVKRKRRLQLLITTTSWDSPLSVRSFWN